MHRTLRAPLALLLCTMAAARVARAQSADALSLPELTRRADSLWTLERYDEAFTAYEVLARRDSTRGRTVYRLATLLSWRNRMDESIALFRRYVRLSPGDPDGRVALGRTLAWAARYDESLAQYDSVLAVDPAHRAATLGVAQTLAWAERHDAAVQRYRAWLAAHPDDREARLGLARTLAWAGRLREAAALYRDVAARSGATGDAEAQKGLARVTGWQGALVESEAQWRGVVAADPNDAEAWTGLAQVLRWQGRAPEAEAALRRALAAKRDYPDARALLPWVLADVRPSLEPAVTSSQDSDENRTTLYTLTASLATPWRGRLSATGAYRTATLPGVEGTASSLRLAATWADVRGRLSARAEAGGERLAGREAGGERRTHDELVAGARLGWRVSPRAGVGVSAARAPFDETALLIVRGIVVTSVAASGDVALPGRLSLSGALEGARVDGPTMNRRRSAVAVLRWAQSRRLSLHALGRTFGYDTTTREGYFAPERYALLEGGARLTLGRDIGWSGGADAGLGAQSLRMTAGSPVTKAAQRAGLFATWRPRPGYEVNANAAWANVAAPGQIGDADYSYTSFTLGGRVRL